MKKIFTILISLLLVLSISSLVLGTTGASGGASGGGASSSGGVNPSLVNSNLVETESYLMQTSTRNLEIANSNTATGLITGETIYDILTWIGKNELKNTLTEETYTTRTNSYKYNQYLFFDTKNTNTNEIVKYAENDQDVSSDFFFVDSNKNIGKYKLEFNSVAKSSIYTTGGSVSTYGTVLSDFEDTKIEMLGKEYTIVLARRPASTPEDSVKLTLMSGLGKGTIKIGEEKIFKSNSNKTYKIKLFYLDASYAQFDINGEVTLKLQKGSIYKLTDGTRIGVSELRYSNLDSNLSSVDFYLGAEKMILRDDDITDSVSGYEVKINSERVDGADVIIKGYDDNTLSKIYAIEVNMTAQDDYYVGKGETLSDAISAQGDDKELLFTNRWDIKYSGLTSETTHNIKIYPDTSNLYVLYWYDGDGNEIDLPVAYADNNTAILGVKKDEWQLHLKEKISIKKNDYFVMTGGNIENGTAKSFALQYLGADNSSTTSPKIKFMNIGTGTNLEYSINTDSTNTVADIKLGGFTFKVENASTKTSKDFDIYVDLDATGKVSTVTPVSGTLKEGEEGTYKLGSTSYSIWLVYTDSTYAKFRINKEEITPKLKVGDSYTLKDGNKIKVTKILYQSYAGGVHSSDFELAESFSNIGIKDGHKASIIDSYGAKIDVSKSSQKIDVTINTPKKYYEDTKPSEIKLTLGAVENKVDMKLSVGSKVQESYSLPLIEPENEQNMFYGYTSIGGKMTYKTPTSNPESFTYNYPQKQRFPQVYIVGYKENNSFTKITTTNDTSLGGYFCPVYTSGISIHEATSGDAQVTQVVADNTYANGWIFSFFMTVPENENKISMWVDDWDNDDGGDDLDTKGNVKIKYKGNDYTIGKKTDYSDSTSFTATDKCPSCPGLQVEFDLMIKLPKNTDYGYYSTSYGIKSTK